MKSEWKLPASVLDSAIDVLTLLESNPQLCTQFLDLQQLPSEVRMQLIREMFIEIGGNCFEVLGEIEMAIVFKSICESLTKERAETGSGERGNGVRRHES